MSHKTKSKARAMPVEAILTRNKLAQLKQNKVHKNAKLNAENELLKLKNCKRKISKKTVIEEMKEFLPDKAKRKIEFRKVMLKPKHNHTVIADMTKCNKRKLNVPKKDLSQANPTVSPPINNEESVFELITQMEGTQEMSDDDFLEILTCPSPVWWEEPPPGYTEDPISADYIKKDDLIVENDKVFESNTTNNKKILNINKSINLKTDMKNDSKYYNKSKKLEALLGNIKIKKSNNSNSLRNSELSVNKNELKENKNELNENKNELKENKKIDGIENDICRTKVDKSQNETESIVSNLKDNTIDELDKLSEDVHTFKDRSSPICIEINSDETDQEDLMNVSLDDKTLLFLENMEIPIVQS